LKPNGFYRGWRRDLPCGKGVRQESGAIALPDHKKRVISPIYPKKKNLDLDIPIEHM
jgi:hypothetical protein